VPGKVISVDPSSKSTRVLSMLAARNLSLVESVSMHFSIQRGPQREMSRRKRGEGTNVPASKWNQWKNEN